jgi:hypothetical protein
MAERHGLKQPTFLDRLSAWADEIRDQAEAMAPEQNALQKTGSGRRGHKTLQLDQLAGASTAKVIVQGPLFRALA